MTDKNLAFVAHTFLPSDDPVWNSISEALRIFKETSKWFDYTDGRSPNPIDVGEKVREKIDRAGIFIGILTHRKLLFPEKISFSTMLNLCNSKSRRFSTSNWVIQESGYALGKGDKKIILLVEEGIEDIPNLQGNTEYIPFNRDDLNKGVATLLQMLVAVHSEIEISLKAGLKVDLLAAPEKSATIDGAEESGSQDKAAPSVYAELIDAFHEKDLGKFDAVYKQRIGELAVEKQVRMTAFYQGMRFRLGVQDAMEELKRLCQTQPTAASHAWLAVCYRDYEQYELAAKEFVAASSLGEEDLRIGNLLNGAECYANANKFEKGYLLLRPLLTEPSISATDLKKIYVTLADMAKKQGHREIEAACLEKAIFYTPADFSLRFRLAYLYSEMNYQALCILHYQICLQNRDPVSLNNLGIEFQSAELKAKGIDCLKESASLGETLAMANIADRYIEAGFAEDAKAILNVARKVEKPHANVSASWAKLEQLFRDEEAKVKQIIEKAHIAEAERIPLAEAFARNADASLFLRVWQFSNGALQLSSDDGVNILGSRVDRIRKEYSMGLLGYLGDPKPKDAFIIRTTSISGYLIGACLIYRLNIAEKDDDSQSVTSILGSSAPTDKTGYGFVVDDRLHLIESEKGKDTVCYSVPRAH